MSCSASRRSYETDSVNRRIFSAGASGAVWGLMTALIATMLRLKWLHGAQQVPVRTWLLLQPLVVNLLISLLPFIDLAGHLGGGVAGAGLVLSGLMWGPRPAPVWRPAARAASLAMAGCLALALAHGRPWELRWPPPLVPRTIPGTPVTVQVPGGLQSAPLAGKGSTVFGNLGSDPLALWCIVGRLDAPAPGQVRPNHLSQFARALATRPLSEGESRDQSPRFVQLRSRPAVFSGSRLGNGGRVQTWVMFEGSWYVWLDVFLRPDAPASWAKLPAAIAEGVVIRAETP